MRHCCLGVETLSGPAVAGAVPNKSGLLALGSRLAETDARAVVIRYFAEIPFDFASGESCLLEAASDFALTVPVFEGFQTEQALMVRFGKPIRGPSVTRISLRWEPQGSALLFPTLAGELDIVEAVGGRSRLTLSIDCAPPAGVPEGAVDPGLTYRVSWVTLNEIEARITVCEGRIIKESGPARGPVPEAPRQVA